MNIIQELSLFGVDVAGHGENIKISYPDEVPPEHAPRVRALVEQVKARKPEIRSLLRLQEDGFTVETDGDVYEVTWDADDADMLWRARKALDDGLIALQGKVLYYTKSDVVRLRYRCACPPEWLPERLAGVRP